MSTLIDPGLMGDVLKFGAADITACYSCGNCTATCPLADNDAAFPRGIIRLAQVGLADDLVSSKELWTCYQCGECTTKCPTQADPAEFMATARRYAIAHYDKSGLARIFATRPVAGWLIAVVFAVVFAGFFLTLRGPQEATSLALFDFIPYPVIHWTGIGVMVLVAVFAVWGVVSLARDMARRDNLTWKSLIGSADNRRRTWAALWYALGIEALGQKRYREDCVSSSPVEPLYRRRWLIHALTLWGFLGLMVATGWTTGSTCWASRPPALPSRCGTPRGRSEPSPAWRCSTASRGSSSGVSARRMWPRAPACRWTGCSSRCCGSRGSRAS